MTVSRVTEAVTASLYAHAADEKWEGDYFTHNLTGGCRDIAQQLIDEYKDIQASSGGKTVQFMRYTGKFRDKQYSL